MRRWFVSSVACLMAVIGATAVAGAEPGVTAPEMFTIDGRDVNRIAIIEPRGGQRSVIGDPGEVLIFTLPLTNENDAIVGKARGQCTLQLHRWEICTYAWDLTARGEIVATGTYPPYEYTDTPPFDLPIIGGTGDFSNVRGTVHVEVLEAAERYTFNLIP